MNSLIRLVEAFGFWGWITIMVVGIVSVVIISQAVVTVNKMKIKHIERMAMINRGENPGDPEKAYKSDKV